MGGFVFVFVFNLANLELRFLGGCESHRFTPSTLSVLVGLGLGSILGHHSGDMSDRVRWCGGGRHVDGQFSLWERWTETAGWLGVRVRPSTGQEGQEGELVTQLGSGLLLVPGGICTLGGKVGSV